MLTILLNYAVNFYKTYILHTLMYLIKSNFSQHYLWPNLRDNIRTRFKVCNSCQKNKKQNLKCGKLPAKEAEAIPWDRLFVDVIVPYKIRI